MTPATYRITFLRVLCDADKRLSNLRKVITIKQLITTYKAVWPLTKNYP